MEKKLINIQAPVDLIKKMKAYAYKNGLTMSMLIRLAVIEYMNNHNNNN